MGRGRARPAHRCASRRGTPRDWGARAELNFGVTVPWTAVSSGEAPRESKDVLVVWSAWLWLLVDPYVRMVHLCKECFGDNVSMVDPMSDGLSWIARSHDRFSMARRDDAQR